MTATPSEPADLDEAHLDAWLASLLGSERDVSLVAVGSFGRGDRAPHSDLDLVLLHRSRRDIGEVANRIWYPIWDRKLRLDHSVRTVKEAVTAADGDLKVALGLLDARHVAGDPKLTAELDSKIGSLWRKRARKWIPQLREAALERHAHFGETAYLLEPEIKEGKGGLRDIALLRSLAEITTVLGDLIGPLDRPYQHLTEIRAALHVRTGRALDRLLLQEQDAIADDLGLRDADHLLGRVSAAATTTAFVWDDCWRRIDGWLDPKRRGAPPDRPLGPGIALQDGEVHLHGPISSWLAAATAAADVRAPLSRRTLQRFVAEVPASVSPWPYGWRQGFVALLGAGHAAIPVLEALDHHGLLVRLLPEWKSVQSKAQRNAYHRFTVDRHLLEAVAQAAALTRRVHRPDLLLLGALLHDIGKGFPGDHTEVGVDLVAKIGPRIGLPPADVAVLVKLVQHHLLLADTATRRDVDDPETAAAVADAVGDRDTLELLAALTEADSLATGPAAWSDWKARLVGTLVERTSAVLQGHGVPEPDIAALVPPFLDDGVHASEDRCVVVAPDRAGLFATVAGVLALNGIDVLGATAGTLPNGRAVEIFDIATATSRPPEWDRVRVDLDAALEGSLPLGERLLHRSRTYARRDLALAAPPKVIVDNDASTKATVIEVRAPDGVGVLHAITSAIAAAGLGIRSARVSTLGHEVVDAFYVVDGGGEKVDDQVLLRDVEQRIVAALDALVAPGQNDEESARST
ncbi:MAG TPA: [protein-PII] uridylyltransferase [Acidimicrobiales bacterium]|nr:[protein-PII] uridylyltransferase [Acidimicrobiales bacterium]